MSAKCPVIVNKCDKDLTKNESDSYYLDLNKAHVIT